MFYRKNHSMWTSISMLIQIIILHKKGGLLSTLTGQAMIICYSAQSRWWTMTLKENTWVKWLQHNEDPPHPSPGTETADSRKQPSGMTIIPYMYMQSTAANISRLVNMYKSNKTVYWLAKKRINILRVTKDDLGWNMLGIYHIVYELLMAAQFALLNSVCDSTCCAVE
jgi:hypothetical protein